MRPSLLVRTGILSLLLLQAQTWALQSDSRQPLEIEAQRMVLDELKSVSTYSGRVILTQGSIVIEAEKLIVYMDNRKLQRLEIFADEIGDAASFRQTLENGQQVRGQSRYMEYRADEAHLALQGQAEFRQGGKHIQSERIDYNTASNSLLAGQGASEQNRVRIVINPDNGQKTEQKK